MASNTTDIATDIPLKSLLDQLNAEFNECLQQLIPKVSNVSEHNDEERQAKANSIQTYRFLQAAKRLEISLAKIVRKERQNEESVLKEEIADLQHNITQQKDVIVKYTNLIKDWTKEFCKLEEENMTPL
ncbi:18468_t:CDS:2 [Acaulospora morrowiae]|uniref:18468_t:CDS:1 n=1 Tax=Acaulospora morrowiae TaxID=94023 RepID=A0A9N9AL33_9GLOM|nr:18468_t:CDS:2 [Acaulospora morrowiae]